MSITITPGRETTITFSGQLDTLTAIDFDREIQQLLQSSAEVLIFNGADLTYISSAGLRSLLIMHKGMAAKGGVLRLTNIQSSVMEIFNITGFSSILHIE